MSNIIKTNLLPNLAINPPIKAPINAPIGTKVVDKPIYLFCSFVFQSKWAANLSEPVFKTDN